MKTCTEENCKSLLANEALLNELDRGSGDGDCGSTLKSGAQGGSHVISIGSCDPTQQQRCWISCHHSTGIYRVTAYEHCLSVLKVTWEEPQEL